jgi:hypothetical protein
MVEKGDIVKLSDNRKSRLSGKWVLPFSGDVEISSVKKNIGIDHYYIQSLVKLGLYTEAQLSNKSVYFMYASAVDRSSTLCLDAIEDELILISKKLPPPIYSNDEKKLFRSMMLSYLIFYIQFDLEGTNINGLESKLKGGSELCGQDLDRVMDVVYEVDSLPCVDPLWDRYMTTDVINYLNDHEDFLLSEYIEELSI